MADGPSTSSTVLHQAEGEVINGLSAYDMQRKPMTRLPDDTEVTIPIRLINSDFRCPVCLGILHTTHATKECLHRFCNECIGKSLRLGKKECPSCRFKCPSRRSLRADMNFDAFIARIYPNRESLEASEAKLEEQIRNNRKALVESLDKGLRRQERMSKMSSRGRIGKVQPKRRMAEMDQEALRMLAGQRRGPVSATPTTVHTEPAQKRPLTATHTDEIEFALINSTDISNKLPPLEKKYIKTSTNCTVQHLCKYLGIKLKNGLTVNDFQITLYKNKSHIILPSYFTLQFILDHYWKTREELVLYYGLRCATQTANE